MPRRPGFPNSSSPKKARIKGVRDFNETFGIPYFKTDLFKYYGVSPRRGYEILAEDNPLADRTRPNSLWDERRGRPLKLSPKDIHRVDRFLQDIGWEARALSWDQLAEELSLDVCGETLKTAMGSMDYHKCIACTKGWVSKKAANRRKEYSAVMKERYPDKEDWRNVRFSDEVHWGVGPEGKTRIIRKPGERYCADCIQETLNREDEKSFERAHSWAAVGYNFKTPLYFYNVPGNRNGKMSLQAYRDQILEPIVKPWLERGDDFILEEDNDSGHGTGKQNIVVSWKKKHGLKHYFNCSHSPDLSPVENCWQPPKQFLKRFPHWDEFETRDLAIEGWEQVSQRFINERVDSMPQRLQDCYDMDGRLTGY
jgi:hypothetical protein